MSIGHKFRPHNPVLQLETAKAFAQLSSPDFSHVQEWALVQAFSALFKTKRLPRYWLLDMQRLIRFEHNYLNLAGPQVVLHPKVPSFFNNRTVLLLTKGEARQFILFTMPSPLTLKSHSIFENTACPINLYSPKNIFPRNGVHKCP